MAADSETTVLRLNRIIDASVDDVFRAWTSPGELMVWFGPEGCVVNTVEADVVVGGYYSIVMTVPGGEQVHHYGQYLEVSSPHRLVFTWVLSDQPCDGGRDQHVDTKVILDLVALGGRTELTLIHERLPGRYVVEAHRKGWGGSLDRLAAHSSAV